MAFGELERCCKGSGFGKNKGRGAAITVCPECPVVSVRLDSIAWRVILIFLNLGYDQGQVRNFRMSCFCGLSGSSCSADLEHDRVEGARLSTEANYFICVQTGCPGWLRAHD